MRLLAIARAPLWSKIVWRHAIAIAHVLCFATQALSALLGWLGWCVGDGACVCVVMRCGHGEVRGEKGKLCMAPALWGGWSSIPVGNQAANENTLRNVSQQHARSRNARAKEPNGAPSEAGTSSAPKKNLTGLTVLTAVRASRASTRRRPRRRRRFLTPGGCLAGKRGGGLQQPNARHGMHAGTKSCIKSTRAWAVLRVYTRRQHDVDPTVCCKRRALSAAKVHAQRARGEGGDVAK